MAGIPFKVIENLFVIDLLRTLNLGYKIESELKAAGGLTLKSHTGEFLALEISGIIEKLPSSNPYKSAAIQIFNRRYLEFQHPAYLLCYCLHPYYRGFGVNDEGFRNTAITATTLWRNLGYPEEEYTPELWWSSIRLKKCYIRDLALRLFGITPSQAACERNFSVLKWMIGDRRTRLDVKKLEGDAINGLPLEETEIQPRTNLVLEDIIDLTQSFDSVEDVNLENDNLWYTTHVLKLQHTS
ncbi:hypothetical protein C1645_878911 [Glomus cerebriforme]|uniref:HAT C-terminal dimerisation domain-containing protein n=1 Tax=Glomus cerebriforme TaxID=658196 RepID=A0A397SPV3_9GLOM|nr:hypothetical protein C1645_878911 [Glomus cerebriforme]